MADAEAERLTHLQQTVRGRRAQGRLDGIVVIALAEPLDLDLVEASEAGLQGAQGLLQRFGKATADGHGLAHRLHRRGQRRLGAGELLEGEARNLGDDVVDGRLERGWGRAAGDVVGDLVEGVSHRELGRDLGDGETRGLGGERGRTRHARVHLDDDHPAGGRVDGELHVRAAGLHADLTQHRERCVAHHLILFVRERQGRGHGDGIAGMDAHRIDVLDGADDDAVVVLITNDLHLVFLPTEDALLDQDLVCRRSVDAALHDVEEFFPVVGDAAAGAAHGEGGADDGRQADFGQRDQRLSDGMLAVALAPVGLACVPLLLECGEGGRASGLVGGGLDPGDLGEVLFAIHLLGGGCVGDGRFRRFQADLGHRVAKQLPILGLVDGLGRCADHLDVEFFEYAQLLEREGAVQGRLAAHGRQQGEAAGKDVTLLLDDLGNDLRRDRLDIGRIRHVRVGHDGRRVRIDQHDPVTLLAEGLAGLRPGIVELAGLPDHDRTGTDDEDRGEVGAFRHRAPWLADARIRQARRHNLERAGYGRERRE